MAVKRTSKASGLKRYSALLAVLLAVLSLFFAACNKASDGDDVTESSAEITSETTAEITTAAETTTAEITTEIGTTGNPPAATTAASIFSEADQLYFKDCVFIGDSITTGIELYGVTKDATVLADKGLNTTSVMKYVSDVGKIKPKYIYIMLGSNDIGFANMTPDRLIANYDKFVKGVKDASPASVIFLQSVFPVTKAFEVKRPAYTNENIDGYNARISQMAAENGVRYLNVAEALKDENNDLRHEISPGEGMHIEKKGYYIWLQYVLDHKVTEG